MGKRIVVEATISLTKRTITGSKEKVLLAKGVASGSGGQSIGQRFTFSVVAFGEPMGRNQKSGYGVLPQRKVHSIKHPGLVVRGTVSVRPGFLTL